VLWRDPLHRKYLTYFTPGVAAMRQRRINLGPFSGTLNEKETAEALRGQRDTVKRDWRLVKVWLLEELTEGGRDEA
jgi:hypothetical protein